MNVLVRIGFDSTIELVSFDQSQVVSFNGKFIYGFRNSNCGTRSRSNNTVDSPHGFVVHRIIVLKGIKKVTEVVEIKDWNVDSSGLLRWFVSSFERNSPVSTTKSSIQVDDVLDEGASRSMVVDEGKPAISTSLGVTATGIGEQHFVES
nr:hypothetical protein [Tanacetum cinerariifolium]